MEKLKIFYKWKTNYYFDKREGETDYYYLSIFLKKSIFLEKTCFFSTPFYRKMLLSYFFPKLINKRISVIPKDRFNLMFLLIFAKDDKIYFTGEDFLLFTSPLPTHPMYINSQYPTAYLGLSRRKTLLILILSVLNFQEMSLIVKFHSSS